MKKSLFFVIIYLLFFVSLSAQTFYGEIRQRGEYRNGYKIPADSASEYAAFISQRSRLGVDFNLENLQMKICFQDVRAWGDQKLKTNKPNTGLYEAWAAVKLNDSIWLKLGRQELIYDNQRLLSNNNWGQTGQVHDAAIIKLKHKGLIADLGLAYNSQQESFWGNDYSASFKGNALENNYKAMGFLYLRKQLFPKLKLSFTSLADAFQKENTTNTNYIRGTFAGYIIHNLNPNTEVDFLLAYQTGKTKQAYNINAWYFGHGAKKKITENYSIHTGVEIFSGNDKNSDVEFKHNAFSTLYGTGHTYNGFIDFFTDIPTHTKNAGLIDIFLRNSYKISNKTDIKLNYHYFKLQNTFVHKEATTNTLYKYSYLGSELDLNLNFNISREINLLLGYSIFLPEKPLDLILGGKEGKLSHWGFAMLTLKPKFIVTK